MAFCSTKPPLWRDATFLENSNRLWFSRLLPYALSRSCATRRTKEVSMRKVVAMELVSLDGVLEGHGGVPGL